MFSAESIIFYIRTLNTFFVFTSTVIWTSDLPALWLMHQREVKSHLHWSWMCSVVHQVSSCCRERWHLGAPLLVMWPDRQQEREKVSFKLMLGCIFTFCSPFISKVLFLMLLTGMKTEKKNTKCSLVLSFTGSREEVLIFHLVIINFP